MMEFCPICGSKVEKTTTEETYEYKGMQLRVKDLPIFCCSGCGEEFINEEEIGPINKKLDLLYREAENLLTPEEIVKIRKNYLYTQEDFARIVGGGVKAFAKYENGAIVQSRPMDNLLRILKAYPYTIDVLIDKSSKMIPLQQGNLNYRPQIQDPYKYRLNSDFTLEELKEAI